MGREGSPLGHQLSGERQGLRRRQRFLRDRFDAGSPVGQRSAESITRSFLARSTRSVPVPSVGVIAGTHRSLRRMIPNAMSAS